MNKLSFSGYDFFGYLMSGLTVLIAFQFTVGFPSLLGQKLNLLDQFTALSAAYIIGHVVANPAKAILEDIFVKKVLKLPTENLFNESGNHFWHHLFPGYFKPLPSEIQQRVRHRLEDMNCEKSGESLFLTVRFGKEVKDSEATMQRLDRFLNLYGFSRNLSFTFLLSSFSLFLYSLLGNNPPLYVQYYATGLFISGIGLFYRYLKFFRQYAYEMYSCFGLSGENSL